MIPLVILLMVGLGQDSATPCPSGWQPYVVQGISYCKIAEKPAPLKCGKWEHEDNKMVTLCNALSPEARHKLTECVNPLPFCAPIMHTVTEKEWQELMERLKKLEGDR